MLTPDWLMGRHADTPTEMIDWVHRLLADEAGVHNHEHRLYFENAGEIWVYEKPNEAAVEIRVPLPYLDAADLTTDELQEAIVPCAPTGIKVEVAIAPPPDV